MTASLVTGVRFSSARTAPLRSGLNVGSQRPLALLPRSRQVASKSRQATAPGLNHSFSKWPTETLRLGTVPEASASGRYLSLIFRREVTITSPPARLPRLLVFGARSSSSRRFPTGRGGLADRLLVALPERTPIDSANHPAFEARAATTASANRPPRQPTILNRSAARTLVFERVLTRWIEPSRDLARMHRVLVARGAGAARATRNSFVHQPRAVGSRAR